MALYGVGLNVTIQKINLELKLHIAKKVGASVKKLSNIFAQFDRNGNRRLDIKEFEQCLAAFGFFPKKVDLQALLKFYDKNGDGCIDFEEFIGAIRDPLNERRLKLVDKSWRKLDSAGNGNVDVQTLHENFSAEKNKEVLEKKKTQDDVFEELLYDLGVSKDPKDVVSKGAFFEYYQDLGVSIPSDNYFSELVQATWGISEDKESTISKNEIKDIIKTLRFKLIQASKGSQDEFLLRKLFKEFDSSGTGFLTIDNLKAVLIRLETPVDSKYLAAVFSFVDKNKSGYIEFEEFANLIVNDSFP